MRELHLEYAKTVVKTLCIAFEDTILYLPIDRQDRIELYARALGLSIEDVTRILDSPINTSQHVAEGRESGSSLGVSIEGAPAGETSMVRFANPLPPGNLICAASRAGVSPRAMIDRTLSILEKIDDALGY